MPNLEKNYIGNRQVRTINADFKTREDAENGNLYIEGYFAVFGSNYEIDKYMSESIDPNAFNSSISGDIRALVNHDTTLVLGRTKANTLTLETDAHGLFGRITINRNDSDAMNCYERVKRGDVDGCSFGFDIISEETDFREDGSVHWTITDLVLYEVSCCTFPAYEETNISARSHQRDELQKRRTDAWRETMRRRLHNAEGSNASEEN